MAVHGALCVFQMFAISRHRRPVLTAELDINFYDITTTGIAMGNMGQWIKGVLGSGIGYVSGETIEPTA